ncbi:MAG: hypothetical protein CMJ75_05705 [Planctomycetaceae bacterium]|mgnify:CR=1 FL=1|nr:hypothetical protein [Planctomycetaceae bacterium]
MRRRANRKPETRVALFPFLAVLVCTMGALIVLLVLVVQQARVQAVEIVRPDPAADLTAQAASQRRQEQREDLNWRSEILAQQRTEKTTELADRRLALSHLEEHLTQMEAQWNKLLEERKAFHALDSPSQANLEQARQQLSKLQTQIDQAQKELERSRQDLQQRPAAYAIIPYHGPQATKRRPLYIECAPAGLIIQPEQIVLTAEELAGPTGPGNPLAAVLRAKREYYRRLGDSEEPYPLIVVRSDGILAYGAARRSMQGWDDEFGYELVDAQRELHYPPADDRLKQSLQHVIELARKRQLALTRAMPRRYQQESGGQLRATTNRGFVRAPASGPGTGRGGRQRPGTRRNGVTRPPESYRPPPATAGSGNVAGRHTYPRSEKPDTDNPRGMAAGSARRATARNTAAATAGSAPNQSSTASGAIGTAKDDTAPTSLAKSRGSNFALPKYENDLTEIQRTIRIQCYSDRLVIQKERGVDARDLAVPVQGAMSNDIESLIARIWDRMERWGLAIPGGYWKPVLKIDVQPNAEHRFLELSTLLRDSGMIVERAKR